MGRFLNGLWWESCRGSASSFFVSVRRFSVSSVFPVDRRWTPLELISNFLRSDESKGKFSSAGVSFSASFVLWHQRGQRAHTQHSKHIIHVCYQLCTFPIAKSPHSAWRCNRDLKQHFPSLMRKSDIWCPSCFFLLLLLLVGFVVKLSADAFHVFDVRVIIAWNKKLEVVTLNESGFIGSSLKNGSFLSLSPKYSRHHQRSWSECMHACLVLPLCRLPGIGQSEQLVSERINWWATTFKAPLLESKNNNKIF